MPYTLPASVDQQLILDATASGPGRIFSIPPTHNWVEMIVRSDATVVAGDVSLLRISGIPQGGSVRGLAGTALYNVLGGRVIARVAPGARVQAELVGYVGPGTIRAVLVSWEGI